MCGWSGGSNTWKAEAICVEDADVETITVTGTRPGTGGGTAECLESSCSADRVLAADTMPWHAASAALDANSPVCVDGACVECGADGDCSGTSPVCDTENEAKRSIAVPSQGAMRELAGASDRIATRRGGGAASLGHQRPWILR